MERAESAPRHAADPAGARRRRGRVVVVDRPGSVQSEIAVAWQGPDRHATGGWARYPVIGYLLGGSPNARIDAVLREDKFTYGIRSGFRPRRASGLFLTTGSVRADATVESVQILTELLDPGRVTLHRGGGPRRSGFPRRDRTRSLRHRRRHRRRGGQPGHGPAASRLHHLEPGGDARAHGRADGCLCSTRPERWCVIVVGDAAEIADGLQGLGIGPVTVVPS